MKESWICASVSCTRPLMGSPPWGKLKRLTPLHGVPTDPHPTDYLTDYSADYPMDYPHGLP